MKKNDYFIDVSAYQAGDLTAICSAAGTRNTIIKVSEGTGWLSPVRVTQTQTSNCVGYYHFARFGGNVSLAQAEADHFISHLPSRPKYLVCDYEDGASTSKQANTDAILAFMDRCASAGYKPIYYSYKPYTLANVDYTQILAKYPNSLWIAAYPNYNVTPAPVWSIFPSMDGIRWWQFTSTGIAGGLDKNIVLLDDEPSKSTEQLIAEEIEEEGEHDMLLITNKENRNTPMLLLKGSKICGIPEDKGNVKAFEKAGAVSIAVTNEMYKYLKATYK